MELPTTGDVEPAAYFSMAFKAESATYVLPAASAVTCCGAFNPVASGWIAAEEITETAAACPMPVKYPLPPEITALLEFSACTSAPTLPADVGFRATQ